MRIMRLALYQAGKSFHPRAKIYFLSVGNTFYLDKSFRLIKPEGFAAEQNNLLSLRT